MEQYGYRSDREYIQVPISDKSVAGEISGDFTLPDYQPEIKRLLKISSVVLPPSRYIGDKEAELTGNIDYYVYYTGSDNEIYCAPLTTEYKMSVPIDSDVGSELANMAGCVYVVPDMTSGRVLSPRKLSIKCRLRAGAKIFGDMQLLRGIDTSSDDVQVLRGEGNAIRMVCRAGELLHLSDEVLSGTQDGEVRVISADGRALMSEVSCSEGQINCRGELYLKLLMSRENGAAPYSVIRKIPFSQTVAVEGVTPDGTASAKGTVCEINVTVEDGRIGIDVGMMIEASSTAPEHFEYIKDVYSTTRDTVCEHRKVAVTDYAQGVNGNFSLNETMTLEEAGVSPESLPVDLSGAVQIDDYAFADRKCIMSGKVKFTALMDKEDEYSVSDIEMPFRYEVDASALRGNGKKNANFSPDVVSARARVDGERINIDAEISVCGTMWEIGEISMLDGVSYGDMIEKRRGEYLVSYPSDSDTLWSVAKRYKVPVSSIVIGNMMNEQIDIDSKGSLDGVSYLIV